MFIESSRDENRARLALVSQATKTLAEFHTFSGRGNEFKEHNKTAIELIKAAIEKLELKYEN